ncbi:MAG: sugar transferase [bacterium]
MSYPKWKRVFDVVGAFVGLIIIVPFVPFIALAIKIETQGPVIVKLGRISEGRRVEVYKFRSMIVGSARFKKNLVHLNERSDGPFFKIRKDPRLTKTGVFLRKFRIDEFPQFINVLKGELALVGPRPHEPEEVAAYPEEYKHVASCRAGVTGYSQVNGSSSLPFLRELELDSWYIQHVSLLGDMRVIMKTIAILFFDPTAV